MSNKSHTQQTSLGDIIHILFTHLWLPAASIVIAVTVASINHFYFPWYIARASLVLHLSENRALAAISSTMGPLNLNGMTPQMEQEKHIVSLTAFDSYLTLAKEIVSSRGPLHEALMKRLELDPSSRKLSKTQMDEPQETRLAQLLVSLISIGKAGNNGILMEVATTDASLAAQLANFTIESAVKRINDYAKKDLSEATQFIEKRLEETHKRVENITAKIIAFKQNRRIMSIGAAQAEMAGTTHSLKKDLERAQIEFRSNEKLMAGLKRDLLRSEREFSKASDSTSGDRMLVVQLREQLNRLKQQKTGLKAQGYGETSELVQELDREMNTLEKRYRSARSQFPDSGNSTLPTSATERAAMQTKLSSLKTDNHVLSAKIETFRRLLKDNQSSQETLPEDEQTFLDLQRSAEAEYLYMKEMKSIALQVEMQKISQGDQAKTIERALPSTVTRKMSLSKALLLALLVGTFIGCGLAFLAEDISPRIKSRNDIKQFTYHLLGSVSNFQPGGLQGILTALRGMPAQHLPTAHNLDSPLTMTFKLLRSRLLQALKQISIPAQTFCFVSSESGDGKSFITSHLALSVAALGKPALLVDCDLRKPTVSHFFQIDSAQGLAEVLDKKLMIEQAIIKNVSPNLDCLPAGTYLPHSSELFATEHFEHILTALKTKYSFIIIDTPALNIVAESASIALASDAVLLVVSRGKTRFDSISETLQRFTQTTKPLYFILNRAESIGTYGTYGYTSVSPHSKTKEDKAHAA